MTLPAPPPWPPEDDAVRDALLACYASGDWGRYEGKFTRELIARLCQEFATEQAILCASGTIAVELALRGLKVGPGDEVILAGYDFPGNFRAIEALGARPVLVDVAADSWVIDGSLLAGAMSAATKAVIVSHLHGHLAEMPGLLKFAHELGLKVVEDACQAPGAVIQGQPVGSYGDVSVLSFGGSKLLTAGRGGAVLTSQAEVAQRIRTYTFRGNEAYPLSELQAAVLLPQLDQLANRTQRRAESAAQLQSLLRDVDELAAGPEARANDKPAYYKIAWRYRPAIGGIQADCSNPSRDDLISDLQRHGIAVDAGFRGFSKRSANRCRIASNLTHATSAAEATLVLHHPRLLGSAEQVAELAETMRRVFEQD
jgi:dTDP-4-amino-4,6-dideoxygalactose transaminase